MNDDALMSSWGHPILRRAGDDGDDGHDTMVMMMLLLMMNEHDDAQTERPHGATQKASSRPNLRLIRPALLFQITKSYQGILATVARLQALNQLSTHPGATNVNINGDHLAALENCMEQFGDNLKTTLG